MDDSLNDDIKKGKKRRRKRTLHYAGRKERIQDKLTNLKVERSNIEGLLCSAYVENEELRRRLVNLHSSCLL